MREGVAWKSFKGSAILGVDAQMPRTLPQWGGKYGDAGGARRSKAQAGVWPRVRLRASREETSRLVGLKPSRRYLSLLLQDLGTPPPHTHTFGRWWGQEAPRAAPGLPHGSRTAAAPPPRAPRWPLGTYPVPGPNACAPRGNRRGYAGPGGCRGVNERPEARAFLRLAG